MVDINNNIKSGPSSLTFEELTDILAKYNVYYKELKCEAKDKPDCYIGLRGKSDPTRIYKVTLVAESKKKKTFHIRWPMYIPRENYFQNIPAESGRFVDADYANVTEASYLAEHWPTTITITNNNYRPSTRNYNMEGKSSPEFDAQLRAAMAASTRDEFPEEMREDNPGPQPNQRNVRFTDKTTVMNNIPNPTEYMGNLNYEEALAKALALSVGQEVGGGDVVAPEPNTEVPALPTTTPPTTRDLSEVEFDLIIEEISEPQSAAASRSMDMDEEKISELVVPDFLRDDLYDGISPETSEDWLERLKRTNVVSERDHMMVDIFLD